MQRIGPTEAHHPTVQAHRGDMGRCHDHIGSQREDRQPPQRMLQPRIRQQPPRRRQRQPRGHEQRQGRQEWERRVTTLQASAAAAPTFGGLGYSVADFSAPTR